MGSFEDRFRSQNNEEKRNGQRPTIPNIDAIHPQSPNKREDMQETPNPNINLGVNPGQPTPPNPGGATPNPQPKQQQPQQQQQQQQQQQGTAGGVSPDGLFDDVKDYGDQGPQQYGGQQSKQQQQQRQQPQQGQQQGQQPQQGQQNTNSGGSQQVMTFVGVIALIVVLIVIFIFGRNMLKKKRRADNEMAYLYGKGSNEILDLSGTNDILAGKTPEKEKEGLFSGKSDEEYQDPNNYTEAEAENVQPEDYYMQADPNAESVIVKFKKQIDEDERTSVELDLEGYGKYKVYIPLARYKELKDSGFMVVDVEFVNDKPVYMYISPKQENLDKMLKD